VCHISVVLETVLIVVSEQKLDPRTKITESHSNVNISCKSTMFKK